MSRAPSSRDKHNGEGQSSARAGKGVSLTQSLRLARRCGIILSLGLLIAVTCLTSLRASAQASPVKETPESMQPPPIPGDYAPSRDNNPHPISAKQRDNIIEANFQKSKSDAAALADLAKAIREELNKPNVNTVSFEVVSRAERIEKLAKKIRDEMKGF